MTSEIAAFLDNLDSSFVSVKNQASKYFDDNSTIRDDGTVQIYNRPWIAPLNFGLSLFPPVDKNWFDAFCENTGIEIPKFYQEILLQMNGCRIYHFSLYGLPKSLYESRLLDRSMIQPLSLESANTFWKTNFNIDNNLFYIGSRRFNDDENSGYFLDQDKIFSIRQNGQIINSWDSFTEFLNEEVSAEEQHMLQVKFTT